MAAAKKQPIRCTNCGSQDLCYLEYETYCRECGLVLQGVPSIDHYDCGYIIGGKRATSMEVDERIK